MATKKTPIKDVDEVSGEIEATEVKNESEKYDPMELVRVKYFKDNGRYKDDITVGYNGRMYKVQRGVYVEIPRVVDEIIQQSFAQDLHSAEYQERLQNEYLEESRKYA